nr:11053_t:CDS:2 [Entrophospora candida]
MEAQRVYLTGSMKMYSKVAEYNAKTLFSEDYSNIFPSQNGRIEASTDEENNLMFGKGEKDEANYNNSLDVQINIEKTKFLELRGRNIYPLCKPFRELSKENAEGLFDVIADDNTAVEFNLPKNIKEYLKDLFSGDVKNAFSKIEKSLNYDANEKNWSTQTVYPETDAVLYQDKDATILYEQSYGPMEFVLSHQLDDFVKLAKNGVDDLNYHFTHNNNCTTIMAMKFKSVGIHGYKYLISVYLTDIIRVKTYKIYEIFCFKIPISYSEKWELLNIARFGAL